MNAHFYKSYGFESIHDLEHFLDRDDVKQMIGKHYDHYHNLWLRNYAHVVMGEPKVKTKGAINWLALIGPPIWFGYRRMYGAVFCFMAVSAVLGFVQQYYDIDANMAGALLVFAFLGKDMYLHHLVKCTQKIDAMPNRERVSQFLRWRRGVSIWFALVSLPLCILFGVVGVSIGAYLSGNPI